MNDKMTIEELVDAANAILNSSIKSGDDARIRNELSIRRARDYLTKGLIDKPFKEGRNTYYNQHHLEQLITLRELQMQGLSESYIQSNANNSRSYINRQEVNQSNDYSNSSDDNQLRANAFELLEKMKPDNSSLFIGSCASASTSSFFNSTYISRKESAPVLANVMIQSKTWIEYQLDTEGKVFLKLDPNDISADKEEMLKRFKNILNIK